MDRFLSRWLSGLRAEAGLRRGLFVAALSGLVATCIFFLLDPGIPAAHRSLGLMGALVLVARWTLLLRMGRRSPVLDALEVAAVVAVGVAVVPDRMSGVLYAGLAFRSAYGSRSLAVRGAFVYAGACALSAYLIDGQDYDYSVAGALLQTPALLMVALLVNELVRGVGALHAAARRERVLQRVAVSYLQAADRQRLADHSAQALEELLGAELAGFTVTLDSPSGAPAVALRLPLVAPGEPIVLDIATATGSAGTLSVLPAGVLRRADRRSLAALAGQLSLAVAALEAQALRQARAASARILSLVEDTGGVALIVDRELVIAWSTPGALELLGEPPDALVGRSVLECLHRGDRERAGVALAAVVAEEAQGPDRFTVRLRGSARWVELSVSDFLADDAVGALVVQLRDVSARVALEQDVRRRDDVDALTGLPNREHFEDLVTEALRVAPAGVAVALLDLDGLREVNETYGYAVGDEVLIEVARRFGHSAAGSGPVARMAADEFSLLLREMPDGDTALDVVNRMLRVLEHPLETSAATLRVRASAGVALAVAHASDASGLIATADAAMQDAQEAGGGRSCLYAPELHAERLERVTLKAELAAAIDAGELELDYQPVIDGRNGQWRSAEALVRWRHPRLGRLGPGRFIPLAEESELIIALGEWVMHEACATLAGWRREGIVPGDFGVAVNVSAVQFVRPDLLDMVSSALIGSGLPAECLTIEVTETAVADLGTARPSLQGLKAIGVRVALDDFGTGHSSLAYLKELPADVIKVPRPFVRDLGRPGSGGAIVEGIVGLAHSLGIVPLAEGVETAEQRDGVLAAGCHLIQGFFYSRPLAAHVFADAARRASVLDHVP